jgi:hypothetical protein
MDYTKQKEKTQEGKIKNPEIKFLRSVAGFTREGPNRKY